MNRHAAFQALTLAAVLAGCGDAGGTSTAAVAPPSRVERLPSERELTRLTLTSQAVTRLGITTAPVEERALPSIRRVVGEVALPSDAVRLLAAPVACSVTDESPLPAVGAEVAAGDLLATLSPTVPPEALANLRVATAVAEGDVERARVRTELATLQRDRTQRLLDAGATSVRLADETRAEFDSATAALAAAERSRDVLLDATPSTAGGTARFEIRAPFAGVIRRVDASSGQEVAAGAPLLEVIDPTRSWLRVPIHVGELATLDLAADISVQYGERRFTATPVAAPPSADPLTATVDLFYGLGENAATLRPGERVEVSLRVGPATATRVVPWRAVVFDAYGGGWVYQAESPTTFVRGRVDVERVDGEVAVLRHGPAIGTLVVTAGATELFGVEFGGFK